MEELQKLIRRMARENPTWGEERIAAELLVKNMPNRIARTQNSILRSFNFRRARLARFRLMQPISLHRVQVAVGNC